MRRFYTGTEQPNIAVHPTGADGMLRAGG
jgi:hypothetical protein